MFKNVVAIAMIAALAACAGVSSLRDDLQPLVGQDIKAAVAVLGYPDGQREMLGDTIYVWSSSRSVPLLFPTSSTTTGTVGGTTVIAASNSYRPVTGIFHCTIQMAVDSANRIKSYQVDGNNGGCARYARRVQAAR